MVRQMKSEMPKVTGADIRSEERAQQEIFDFVSKLVVSTRRTTWAQHFVKSVIPGDRTVSTVNDIAKIVLMRRAAQRKTLITE